MKKMIILLVAFIAFYSIASAQEVLTAGTCSIVVPDGFQSAHTDDMSYFIDKNSDIIFASVISLSWPNPNYTNSGELCSFLSSLKNSEGFENSSLAQFDECGGLIADGNNRTVMLIANRYEIIYCVVQSIDEKRREDIARQVIDNMTVKENPVIYYPNNQNESTDIPQDEQTAVKPVGILADSSIALKMDEANSLYRFDDLIALCESCLTDDVPSDDPVRTILALAQEAKDLSQNFKITYDKFGEKYDIIYTGLEDVSDTVSVATHGTIKKYDFSGYSSLGVETSWKPDYSSKVGFTNSDWLFFDTVYVAGDNMDSFTYTGRSNRDIIDGDTIAEYVEWYNVDLEEATTIKNAMNPEIRFLNSENGNVIDRPLSESEVDAIYSFARVHRIYVEISDIIFRSQKDSGNLS